MKISLCGSMQHVDAMVAASKQLEDMGYEVEIPNPRDGEVDYLTLPDGERQNLKDILMREHLAKISDSDAVLIFNEDKKGIEGYIGGNTLMEMAFAYAQKLEIFILKQATGVSYLDEIEGMKPILINGDINVIDAHYAALPKTYVSSKSPIKLRAFSRGMRRAGIRAHVLAHPTDSNVAEQPSTIAETYEGATNRHDALVREFENSAERPAYFATFEGGNHPIHENHNVFTGGVVILERVGLERKIGISLDLEAPKEMTDKVPSIYPDIGVLVQKEYGSTLKDPFPYFTNGKIKRLELVENAVYNIAVQFPEK